MRAIAAVVDKLDLRGLYADICPVQPERDGRVKRAQRGQITWGRVDLDAEVPADHACDRRRRRQARSARALRRRLSGAAGARREGQARTARPDHMGTGRPRRRGARRSCVRSPPSSTSSICAGSTADVRARGESAGAPATAPKILLGLRVYATSDGVGSGREVARLVELHAAHRWLCGGGAVAYHRLNDFRSDHGDVFRELVTQLLARPMKHDLIDPRAAPASAAPPALRRFEAVRPSSGSYSSLAPTSSRSPAQRPTPRSRPPAGRCARRADTWFRAERASHPTCLAGCGVRLAPRQDARAESGDPRGRRRPDQLAMVARVSGQRATCSAISTRLRSGSRT